MCILPVELGVHVPEEIFELFGDDRHCVTTDSGQEIKPNAADMVGRWVVDLLEWEDVRAKEELLDVTVDEERRITRVGRRDSLRVSS